MTNLHKVHMVRWFLCLWISLIYLCFWGIRLEMPTESNKTSALGLLVFTMLLISHAGLYWMIPRIPKNRVWYLAYFVVQGALVLSACLIPHNQLIALGLYLALMVETIGILEHARTLVVAAIAGMYLALFIITLQLLNVWNYPSLVILDISLILFVSSYFALYIRQVHAHMRSQELLRQLEIAHNKLAVSSARIEELTLANERQRIARELHDTLAQGLAGLIMQLEAINLQIANRHTERAQEIVHQTMTRARDMMASARRAIDNLRPSATYSESLLNIVQEEISRFTTSTGISCIADIALLAMVPRSLFEHVRRTITEGLNNVAHHSQATHVWISAVTTGDDTLCIEVRDDGIGFQLTDLPKQIGHYGLIGVRERAHLVGGHLEIISAPGTGTSMRFLLPTHREESLI